MSACCAFFFLADYIKQAILLIFLFVLFCADNAFICSKEVDVLFSFFFFVTHSDQLADYKFYTFCFAELLICSMSSSFKIGHSSAAANFLICRRHSLCFTDYIMKTSAFTPPHMVLIIIFVIWRDTSNNTQHHSLMYK